AALAVWQNTEAFHKNTDTAGSRFPSTPCAYQNPSLEERPVLGRRMCDFEFLLLGVRELRFGLFCWCDDVPHSFRFRLCLNLQHPSCRFYLRLEKCVGW